ncbi:MAG TPA: hypothetical protein VH682_26340 [Gemmataceae bacterium]
MFFVYGLFLQQSRGKWWKWIDVDFVLLTVLLLLIHLPTLRPHIIPVHDTMYAFQIFYHNYNEFLATNDLSRWLPYGMYGIPAAFDQVICLSPMCYLVGLLGAVARVRDVLFLFKMTLLGEQFLFLLGLYLLGKIIYARRLTRLLVCATAILTTTWITQLWWDWRVYYLLPFILQFLVLFYTRQRPLYLWAAGGTAIASLLGSLIYFSPLLLFILLIIAACLAVGNLRALRTILRPSWTNMLGGLVFGLCAAAYGWQVSHCLDSVTLMVSGRDTTSGRVPLDVFLTYGGQADRQVLMSFLTGWPPFGDNTYYIGLFSLFCVVWGAFNIRSRIFWSFLTAALALILLSLGGMASRLIYHFPMMSLFRHIGLVYGPIKLLLLLAGGFGLDRAVQWILDTRETTIRSRLCFLLVVAMVALIPLDGWLIKSVRELRAHWWETALTLTDLNFIFVCSRLGIYFALAGVLYTIDRFRLLPRGHWRVLVATGITVVVAADTGSYRYLIHATMPKLSGRFPDELQMFHARPLPFCDQRRDMPTDPQTVTALHLYNTLPPRPAHSTYTMAYNFFAFDPSSPKFRTDMFSKRADRLIRARGGLPKQGPDDQFLPADDHWLRVALGCDAPKVKVITDPLIVHGTTQQVLEVIRRLPPDSESVILRNPPEPPAGVSKSHSPTQAAARVDVLHFSGNILVCKTVVPPDKSAWLYYSDSWHPDWRCLIDGVPVQVVEANYAFKAVRLNPGESTVRFTFGGGASLGPSYALAALGLLFSLGSVAYGLWRLSAHSLPSRVIIDEPEGLPP